MRKLLFALAVTGCAGSEEAAQVQLPVTTAASATSAATDLGYAIQIARMRVAVSTIQFTIEGEMHEVAPRPDIAYHPGHSAGGEVTGELPGDFVLTWNGQAQPALGTGTLIVGDYHGANFAFRAADARDSLAAEDPLLGHTFHVTGEIAKAGTTKPFDAVLDVEAGAQIVGAVFESSITEASTAPLALAFFATDPAEGDTAFDGVDFFALPATPAGVIEIRPGSAAHNILRRTFQTHDHYGVLPQ